MFCSLTPPPISRKPCRANPLSKGTPIFVNSGRHEILEYCISCIIIPKLDKTTTVVSPLTKGGLEVELPPPRGVSSPCTLPAQCYPGFRLDRALWRVSAAAGLTTKKTFQHCRILVSWHQPSPLDKSQFRDF